MTKDIIAGLGGMRRGFLGAMSAFAAMAGMGIGMAASARAAAFPPLNDPSTTLQNPGKFIWADLFTSEPDAAVAFYTGVFGWTAAPVEQHDKSYFILSNDGQPVAGIVARDADSAQRPGVWIGYISVAKARDALAAVEAAGGTVRAPAHKFPHRGIEAIFTESEGSVVGILQSSSGDPPDDEPKPGEWNWFELFSHAPRTAAAFYGQALGYEVHADGRADRSGHLLLSSGGRARAGIAPLPEGADSKPGWLGCIRVPDIDATAAKALALGGQVVIAPRAAALGSRFAVISDPTGGAVGLVQYIDNANPGDRP